MATIMIVEDEWLVAEDHAAILRDAGHQVAGPFANVASAVACLRRQPIDAALLDMQLGSEKSFPVAELLHDLKVPFAFASGYEAVELPDLLKGHRVLSKPIPEAEILSAVDQMCGDREDTGQ